MYRYRSRSIGAKGKKYENGSYLEWLDTIERSGHFARSSKQVRAHRQLLLRTLAQLARECRDLPAELARKVLPVIRERREKWNIGPASILFADRLGLRAFGHYLKIQSAQRAIEGRIQDPIN